MGFFSTLSGWFSGQQRGGGKRSYILEASGLSGQRRGGRRSPAEQVQVLQRIARFVDKEKVDITVVLEGKPLREAKDGAKYKGVRVHYSEHGASAGDLVMKLFRKGSRTAAVTVITADRGMEKGILSAGGEVMRSATFRKAIDSADSEKKQSGSGPQKRRPRRRGGRSGGAREGGGNRENKSKDSGPKAAEKKADNSPDAAVRELLDLVE